MSNVADLHERRVEGFLAALEDIEPVGRRIRPKRRHSFTIAFAAAVLLAVAGAVVLAADDARTSPAVLALENAARVAARQPLATGGYTYSKTLTKSRVTFHHERPPFSITVFRTEQVWLAADGSGRASARYGLLDFSSIRVREARKRADELLERSDRHFRLRLRFRDVDKLPRDPDRLVAVIRAEAERASSGRRGVAPFESLEHRMWDRLGGILGTMHSETNRRPRLRAAIFGAFARIEGATLLGNMLDPMGRRGIGVAFRVAGLRDVLVFDPRTSRLLAHKTVVVDPGRHPEYADVDAGSAVYWTAYLESGRVGSLGEIP